MPFELELELGFGFGLGLGLELLPAPARWPARFPAAVGPIGFGPAATRLESELELALASWPSQQIEFTYSAGFARILSQIRCSLSLARSRVRPLDSPASSRDNSHLSNVVASVRRPLSGLRYWRRAGGKRRAGQASRDHKHRK